MRRKHSFIYYYIVFALVMMLLVPMKDALHVKAGLAGYIKGDGGKVNLREAPNQTVLLTLEDGYPLEVLDMSDTWYKVSVNYNGSNYTGYVSGDLERLKSADITESGFPSSYLPYLQKLKEQHPNWEFVPIETGLSWDTVISNEICKYDKTTKKNIIKNTVYCGNDPNYNWRSTNVLYDGTKAELSERWSPADGTTWFAASDELVKYYIDPRTYLDEQYIFVFYSGTYQEGLETEACVESVLSGTFMAGQKPAGENETYAQIIIRAGKESGVSPCFLASRIKQEMGSTAGVAAKGTSSNYPGIFNFYNIGANDVPGGNPVTNGLKWASQSSGYGRPWTSASKSIVGGAKYINEGYISPGQDTLYTQKFNVTNSTTGQLFWHQYMTNVQAPSSEGLSYYKAFKNNNLLNEHIVFKIPVYVGMTETASVKPSSKLSGVSYVTGTPSLNFRETPDINGNRVTDSNGEVIMLHSGQVVTVLDTSVEDWYKISVTISGKKYVGYAFSLYINYDSSQPPEEENILPPTQIKGDLNNDGNVSAIDIVYIQRIIVGLDANDTRADINGDGKVSALDIIKIQRHIVGLESLY